MLGPYNGFTGKQRLYGEQLLKKAIREGRLAPKNRTRCAICGQDKGVRDYHNEDYTPSKIVDDATPLCRHCHNQLHRYKNNNPKEWERYLEKVRKGYRPPPTYTRWWGPEDDFHEIGEPYEKQTTLNEYGNEE